MPRKKPFSGKQKKQQLQVKRDAKRTRHASQGSHREDSDGEESAGASKHLHHLSGDPRDSKCQSRQDRRDRYKLIFQHETKEELKLRKERAMQPYQRLSSEQLEVNMGSYYNPHLLNPLLPLFLVNFPLRPTWDYSLSKQQLENNEEKYFRIWLGKYLSDREEGEDGVGYCETNLETWRQLWRVLEMSDVFLHIVDVRYAALHFNPILCHHILHNLGKQVVVVLNKCDIVPPQVATAWKDYLEQKCPKLRLVMFTSYPKDDRQRAQLAKGKQSRRRRKRASAVGPLELWRVCRDLVGSELDLTSWKDKIESDMSSPYDGASDSDQSDVHVEVELGEHKSKPDLSYYDHRRYKDRTLTIGCIGYPNVGKSSVINALMGKKVVSISRTPGHTKHFQTIYLTSNVRLCDCPGLVFPSDSPRPLQVLAGMYPIAQLREPYSSVQYLAERMDLPACLSLRLPDDDDTWSAYTICDELAELKGFKTAKGARTDPFRAANWILRATLEGKMPFYLLPQGYHNNKEKWANHKDTQQLINLQLERLRSVGESEETKYSVSSQSCASGSAHQSDDSGNSQTDSNPDDDGDTDDDTDDDGPAVATNNAFSLLAAD